MEASTQRLAIVGSGDWMVSADPAVILTTYALGSGLGLAAYDPLVHAGGLLHCLLPDSAENPDKARLQPGAFLDTGLQLLLKDLEALGASRRRLRFHLAGAAESSRLSAAEDPGHRNRLAAKRRLWELGFSEEDEETGGESSRSFRLRISDGHVTVRGIFGERELRHQGFKKP